MEDCMQSENHQLPHTHDDDVDTSHCTDEILLNDDLNPDKNIPESHIIKQDEVQNTVNDDCLKDVDLEERDNTNRESEENKNSYDSDSGMLSVGSDDEIGCSKEEEISHESNTIKSEIFENTHVVVLNKYNKFNARNKPKRSTLRHECDRCEEAFQFPYQLARHKTIKHEGKYPYFCDICKKPFDRSSTLRDHMLVHSENRPHECKECGKKFKMSGNLRKHIRDIHTQQEEPKLVFQCEYCSKLFPTKERLTSHFIVHETEKAFACNVCGKKFNRKNNLKEHVVIHSTEKKFVCPDCGMRFNRKYSLKIHARNHMEVKPYKCELCPSSFSQLHALKTHFRLHTGEKPFKCNICENTFRQLATLQVHLKRHTGVKDFTCGICGRGFIIKRRLIEHERLHTGEKPFSCDICPYHAATTSGLRLHKKTHRRQMERMGIGIEQLLGDGKQSISADGRKRKVFKKVNKPKQPKKDLKEESDSVEVEDVDTEKCIEDKADVKNSDTEEVKEEMSTENQSTAEEITFLQSGHVIEIVNDNTDPSITAISQNNLDYPDDNNDGDDNDDNKDKKNGDDNKDDDDDHSKHDDNDNNVDNEPITSDEVKYCIKEKKSRKRVLKDAYVDEFENMAKEVLYKYLNELIPIVDADLLTQKVDSIVQELSENHTKLLKKKSINNSKRTKKTNGTNDKITSDMSRKTTTGSNNNITHISTPVVEFPPLKKEPLPISDPVSPDINVNSSPSTNVNSSSALNINSSSAFNVNSSSAVKVSSSSAVNISNSSAVNINSPSLEDFSSISKQTVNTGNKDQGPLQSHDNKSIFYSSTLRKMLGSKEPITTQGYVVRREVKPICTNTSSPFTVLKDMLSSPPQHYLISTRNSSAALKHSIKRQSQIASASNGFEGKWHTPDSSWTESSFTWVDEAECLPDIKNTKIKMEPVSP